MSEPAPDIFEQLHVGLVVSLISTPKQNFVACRADEPMSEVIARNTEKFDHMPVVDGTTDTIIGVVSLSAYYDAPSPAGTVADHMALLNEHHLAHANEYGPDSSRAAEVCGQVRSIINIRNLLRSMVP